MSGLALADMESSDMLDVLHYFFEEDIHVVSAESMESRSKARSAIYRDMYKTHYKYGVDTKSASDIYTAGGDKIPSDGFFESEDLTPFNTKSNDEIKPYIPPTDFNDSSTSFGRFIDPPLS